MAEILKLPRYYRCRVMLEGDRPVEIYTPTIPVAWQQDAKRSRDEAVSAVGLFLKLGADDPQSGHPMPVFVAQRIGWHPDTPLGKLQMDVGLLDDVEDRESLTDNDRECFYQLLAAVGRTEPGKLLGEAEKLLADLPEKLKRKGGNELRVAPLFNEVPQQRGRLVVLTGTIHSVVRIRVDDADVRERFGIDHYYNVFLFPDDSQDNPVVFCVRGLPEGMPVGSDPEYAERVRVAGFFMKTWGYPVTRWDASGGGSSGDKTQLAPLLIGRDLKWLVYESPAPNWLAGLIAGGLFVAALAGIWIALWRFGRGDKQFHRQTLSKTYAVDSGVSLDEIGLQTDVDVNYRSNVGGRDEDHPERGNPS